MSNSLELYSESIYTEEFYFIDFICKRTLLSSLLLLYRLSTLNTVALITFFTQKGTKMNSETKSYTHNTLDKNQRPEF